MDNSKSATTSTKGVSTTKSDSSEPEADSPDDDDSYPEVISGYEEPKGVTFEEGQEISTPEIVGIVITSVVVVSSVVAATYLTSLVVAKNKENDED